MQTRTEISGEASATTVAASILYGRRLSGAIALAAWAAAIGAAEANPGPDSRVVVADRGFAALARTDSGSLGARLLREKIPANASLFAQLDSYRRQAKLTGQAARIAADPTGQAAPEFVLRNAANPSEAYSFGGMHKYAFMFGSAMKWSPATINWRYNPAGQPTAYTEADILATLQRATANWEAACNIRFVYGGTTSTAPSIGGCDGSNVVGWAALSGSTVGYTQVCYGGVNLIETDMQLDNQAPLQLNSLALLEMAATHEFGHSLGLGHTAVSPAVMSPSLTTGTLTADDIAGCVALYGAPGGGGSPNASFNSTSMAFAAQLVGTSSAAQSVRLTNTGSATLSITNIAQGGTNPGDFARSGTCSIGTSLGAGQFCDIAATFTPAGIGARGASITITTNAAGSPHAISLTGTGTSPAPVAGLSTTSLAFGSVNVGSASATQNVRVTNTGGGTLSLAALSVGGTNPGDFIRSGNCAAGMALAAGQFCDATIAFVPGAAGARTASLAITSNATPATASVALSGNGVSTAAAVTLSASSLTFASQTIGTASAAQTVNVTSSGTAPLNVTSITMAGTHSAEFVRGGTCAAGLTVAVGASCTVTISFSPVGTGARTASVVLGSNSPNAPSTITLAGTGADSGPPPAPALALSTDLLAFGNQSVGTTSPAQTATLSNTGTANLILSSIASGGVIPGDFPRSGSCTTGMTLVPGASCTISSVFQPTAQGVRSAYFLIISNAPGSPHSLGASGTGTVPVTLTPGIAVSPGALTFGSILVGSAAPAQTVTISSTGSAPLSLSGLSVSGANPGDFPTSGTCAAGVSLAPGTSCTVSVGFAPTATGARSASLAVTGNAGTSQVAFSGNGLTGAALTANPATVSFGSVSVGSASAPVTVRMSNTGGTSLSITSLALLGNNPADFVSVDGCSVNTTLAPGQGCDIAVTFVPAAAGTRSATLRVGSSAGAATTALAGTGQVLAVPGLAGSPLALSIGPVTVGASGGPATARITNTGTAATVIASNGISGAQATEFSASGCAVATTLAAGAFCDVSVTFSPAAAGTRVATLTLTASGVATPVSIALTGTSVNATTPPIAKVTPTSLNFRNVTVGKTSSKRTVTLSNTGGGQLAVGAVGLSGANAADYSIVTTCTNGMLLAASAWCSIDVRATPRAAGTRSATLQIPTSTTTLSVALTTNGVTSTAAKAGVASVQEFYNPNLDHYFITASETEAAALTGGTLKGWEHTGEFFNAILADEPAAAANFAGFGAEIGAGSAPTPVCRFYGNPDRGLDSHFYSGSPDECRDVAARFAGMWLLESDAVMYVYTPDAVSGACPGGTQPLYRLWNRRTDSNHRYTVDPAVRDLMLARGWIAEGYGKNGVAMCLPGE